ncbi:nitroreductase family protein, partial [Candidatus Omnitrophota bacterium]
IKQRRSIRQYTDLALKPKQIEAILEAGTWAPSGLNNQPWKFKVVEDKDRRAGLAKYTKYGRIIKDAPAAICVFLDNAATYNREKDLMAAGACIQNMLLAAHEIGLATCWLGEILNKKEEVGEYLAIDPDCELVAVITLGSSDEEVTKACRKDLKLFILP